MKLTDLRCEYLKNPLGIQAPHPRFSWVCAPDQNTFGQCEDSCRVVCASSMGNLDRGIYDLWDSGRQEAAGTLTYSGSTLSAGQDVFWKAMAWDGNNCPTPWSEPARFSEGLCQNADFKFISCDIRRDADGICSPVLLMKRFSVTGAVAAARIYLSALGVFAVSLNDKPAHDTILAPEWTNYHKRVQYQTFDVTELLQNGFNTIRAYLGNGWYSSIWQSWPPRAHLYGEVPEFFALLEITYADGTRQTVTTDESWRGSCDIRMEFSDIYEGERWNECISEPEDPELMMPVTVRRHPELILTDQKCEPIRITECRKPVSITEPVPGVYVLDFGQNLVGRLNCRFRGKPGQQFLVKHNEVLNPDGTVYMDNLWAGRMAVGRDRQLLRYTSDGTDVWYHPHFTYMGFRYAEIHGMTQKPSCEDFEAQIFHTDMRFSGTFLTSDPELNRLQENIRWSHRGNMMGIPTDCPQRDERCGYTGDMNFFLPTALYNADMAPFMHKWLIDLCQDSALKEGNFADHAPYFGMNCSSTAWGDAGILCPWLVWRTYGDVENIRLHYSAMQRHLDYMIRTANPDGSRGPENVGNGDWLSQGAGASKLLIGSAYYAMMLQMMSDMACAIGHQAEGTAYRQRYEQARKALASRCIRPDGTLVDSSLTGYALLFTADLVPEALYDVCAAAFAAEAERFEYKIATGFIGTPRILPALHRIGRDDLAHKMLFCRQCPSWLYPVTQGATTIWERWDGWTEEKRLKYRGMNSFNHFAFGSVGDYFFSGILGICQKPDSCRYDRFEIRPSFPEKLRFARGGFQTVKGRIACGWEKIGQTIRLEITVPVSAQGELILPQGKIRLLQGRQTAEHTPGKEIKITLPQGTYLLEYTPR